MYWMHTHATRPLGSTAATLLVLLAVAPTSAAQRDALRPVPLAPSDEAEAVRFLTQATFGATEADAAHLIQVGFSQWLEEQEAQPVSLELPFLEQLLAAGEYPWQGDRRSIWWENAVEGPDQLRGRMAFALSEILVISDHGGLEPYAFGMADFYDMLTEQSLGNYRELLGKVTLHPAMGIYLSMLKSQKFDDVSGVRPDENYAREVMQLFTIGLDELNPDGSIRRDAAGETIPTYDQSMVEELARALTGFTFAGTTNWTWPSYDFFQPMEAWPEYHDYGSKLLFGAVTIPAGQTPVQDVDSALDAIFAHPNVGPFLARRLIQRLVTSNPTQAYVRRVAGVFDDNGLGERGDLMAVARAILLDPEARFGHLDQPTVFGKLREPILRHTALLRLLDAQPQSDRYIVWNAENDYGQSPLSSPSVFNFFSPTHKPPGALEQAGLVAPEFQITHHSTITATTNRFWEMIFWQNSDSENPQWWQTLVDLSAPKALAGSPSQLVDYVDTWLMGGLMSPEMRAIVLSLVVDTPFEDDGLLRAREALFIVFSSPEFSVQR